jgi:hypothetical protein
MGNRFLKGLNNFDTSAKKFWQKNKTSGKNIFFPKIEVLFRTIFVNRGHLIIFLFTFNVNNNSKPVAKV